jgi:dihydroorotase-like cyclic amidohydrolase
VLIDPGRPFTIRDEDQQSKARNVPFAGLTVGATPVLACLRGTVIMREGRTVAPPTGRFVRP